VPRAQKDVEPRDIPSCTQEGRVSRLSSTAIDHCNAVLQAVPTAEKLTKEQLQPGADRIASQVEDGAQRVTQEVLLPEAQKLAEQVKLRSDSVSSPVYWEDGRSASRRRCCSPRRRSWQTR